MTLKDLLETAQLDALGLLDDDEAAAFDRAFRAAPPAIQARLREEQARVAGSDAMLPDVLPPASLRASVLGGVFAAMKADPAQAKKLATQAGSSVVATIGPAAAPAAAAACTPAGGVAAGSTLESSALSLSSIGLSGDSSVAPASDARIGSEPSDRLHERLDSRMDVSGRRRRVSPAWRAASLGLLTACVVLGGSLVKVYADGEEAMRSLTDQRSQESFLALFGNSTHMRDVLFAPSARRVLFTPVDNVAEAVGVEAAVFVHPDWSNSRLFVRGLRASPTVSYRLVILNSDNSIKRELAEIRTGSMLETQQFDVAAAAPGTRLAIVLAAPGEPANSSRMIMIAVA